MMNLLSSSKGVSTQTIHKITCRQTLFVPLKDKVNATKPFRISLSSHNKELRNFRIPKPNLSIFKGCILYSGHIIWNSIPNEVKHSSTCSSFTQNVSNWLKPLNNVVLFKQVCLHHCFKSHILPISTSS